MEVCYLIPFVLEDSCTKGILILHINQTPIQG